MLTDEQISAASILQCSKEVGLGAITQVYFRKGARWAIESLSTDEARLKEQASLLNLVSRMHEWGEPPEGYKNALAYIAKKIAELNSPKP